MASLTKIKDGKYKAHLRVFDPEKRDSAGKPVLKRVNKTIYAETKQEALDEARRLELEGRIPGSAAINNNTLVKHYLMDWANNRPDTSKGRPPAPRTQNDDRDKAVMICALIGNYQLKDVNAATMEDLKRKLRATKKKDGTPISPQTVKSRFATAKNALRHAWKIGLIKEDPCAKVSAPHVPKTEAAFATWEQAQQIAEWSRNNGRPEVGHYVIIAFVTGCRPSELSALTWDDVDLEAGTIDINKVASESGKYYDVHDYTKTALSRAVIDLPVPAWEAFKSLHAAYLDAKAENMAWNPRNWVWCAMRRQELPTRPSQTSKYVLDGIRATGNDGLSLYSMRHGSATFLLEQGDSMKSVQDHLRHSTYKLTADTYGHVTERTKARRVSLFDQLGTGGGQ